MNFFLHIGSGKTVSSDGLIGIFNSRSILKSWENLGSFSELFDEEENEKFLNSRSLLLYEDGYLVGSKIKTETLIARRKRLLKVIYHNLF